MAKKTSQPKFRTAIIKKNKSYKFGQALGKGEKVFIKEEFVGHGRWVYTAFRMDENGKEKDSLGFGLTRSEFDYTDKEKFVVCVTRTSYASMNIEVEASDHKEAEQLATEKAGDFEFREHDAEYTADAVRRKADHENLFPNS